MLKDIIPAEWRKPTYAIYAIIGFLLGAIQIGWVPNPEWLITAFAVYAFTGTAFGFVASGNTNTEPETDDEYEPKYADTDPEVIEG